MGKRRRTRGSPSCRRSPALARALSLLALLLALLAGCARGEQPTPTSAPTSAPAPTATAAPTAAAAAPTATPRPTAQPVPEGSFQNPVLRADFPDPHVILADGVYYAYATNASGRNIQVARSENLVEWELLTDAMPALPTWARLGGSLVWAPEVIRIGDTYLLYYTARDKASDKQCIGVATSDRPEGKFRDTREAPLVCQAEEGGSIDPSPFRDGERLFLYWKNDGNCCSLPTYLYVQELAADGLSLVGEATRLVRNDALWEGRVVEAPTMWKQGDSYYLFFSGNSYAGLDYAVGYALCETPAGPCEDAPENPILKTALENPPVIGPGHQTLVAVDDEIWMVYHAWEVASNGLKTSRRFMWLDRVVWEGGRPDVLGPTTAPQLAPEPG